METRPACRLKNVAGSSRGSSLRGHDDDEATMPLFVNPERTLPSSAQ